MGMWTSVQTGRGEWKADIEYREEIEIFWYPIHADCFTASYGNKDSTWEPWGMKQKNIFQTEPSFQAENCPRSLRSE